MSGGRKQRRNQKPVQFFNLVKSPRDALNQVTCDYVFCFTHWVFVQTNLRDELINTGHSEIFKRRVIISGRWTPAIEQITRQDRVVFDGCNWDIIGIDPNKNCKSREFELLLETSD